MSEEATLDEFTKSEGGVESFNGGLVDTNFYPQEWEVVDFEEIIGDIRYGTDTKSNIKENGYPTLRIPNVVEKRITTEDLKHTLLDEEEFKRLKLENGDILLIRTNGNPAYVGRCTLFDGEIDDCIFASYLIRIRLNQDASLPNFVSEFLNSHLGRQEMSGWINTSAGNHNMGISAIENFSVPLPQYEEQRKIATVLYTVDRAIEKTEEIESQARRTQTGVVQRTLKYGLGGSDISETGTKLGEIPAHWEIASIDEIVADEEHSFTDGARYALSSAEIYDEGEARAILLQEVGEGEFNDEDPKFATGEKYDEITHRAIYPGEIVVAKMAEPVARACIVPDTYNKYLLGCADVVRIQTNDEFDSRFLMYCMNSHKVWRQAVSHLRGTGRSRINLENIAELKLPKPPLNEQIEIADILESFDQRIQSERDYRESLQRLKHGLLQDLLSGTVRTTNTNIEVPEEIAQHG